VDGKIHPTGFVQQGGDSASLVTTYAALRPRDGFSHPHQEHMKDTYILLSGAIHFAAGGVRHIRYTQIGIIFGNLISVENIMIIKQ